MKAKILNILLILSSLIGYLEWGKDNSSFLFQVEYDVLKGLFNDFKSVAHPFTLIPLAGQILLIFTLFQKQPSKVLTYIASACLALLLGFMFAIGLMSLNIKITLSILPFFVVLILVIRNFKKG